MTAQSWIADALGRARIDAAKELANERRLRSTLELPEAAAGSDSSICFVANALELQVLDLLGASPGASSAFNASSAGKFNEEVRRSAVQAFQLMRVLPGPKESMERGLWLVRLGCLATLGDRGADFRRFLHQQTLPSLPLQSSAWDQRVLAAILDIWLRLFRKDGWDDLDKVLELVAALRKEQKEFEPEFLKCAESRQDVRPAWELMVNYHLAKAAELLATFLGQGSLDGRYDIRQQLESQFDAAIHAAANGVPPDLETLTRLLAHTAEVLVNNSIWTVTRAVNSRVSKFVKSVLKRPKPIFEMLPPQRRTLREEGLLGSSKRSVVVNLPTSSGKTFIAQFRLLQALNQFDEERGWVAWLAPTRALVNQLAARLRRDLGPLDIAVEKVSPALEIDGLESRLLTEQDTTAQFRVLVTTPEKLDLMLRGGWEERIGRPLTLVVVDEAHGLGSSDRGLKLELLLATINRECRHAQFLLLTPFINNAKEIADWLDPESNQSIELGLDWSPNDRAVVIASPKEAEPRGSFSIIFSTVHTNRGTITVPDGLQLRAGKPLDLTFSKVSSSKTKLAAATAELLSQRGTVVVLADQPNNAWNVAECFNKRQQRLRIPSENLKAVCAFLEHEMGPQFPLPQLLMHGVGVHHAGMSDDARAVVEWLAEQGELNVLVATTTLAQGVNFPVSGVVLASHEHPGKDDRRPMTPEEFWNIAGRAGRVDQGDLGIVALVATDPDKVDELQRFVVRNVQALNSKLIEIVQAVAGQGKLLHLEELHHQPEWSSFLQYLAHTYRQIGNHNQFVMQVEQVLRGTLGFQTLRRDHAEWASQLVQGVHNYAARIEGKPLSLVDSTGFSWETVHATLARLTEARIKQDVWSNDLFHRDREALRQMMGILLKVPELRENLQDVLGGTSQDGAKLAALLCDWVQGRPLAEMAQEYFGEADGDPVAAVTRCCKSVYSKLSQTASWGLAALQALTLKSDIEKLPEQEQRRLRNLPAQVFYGVDSEEAVAMRLLGVPRMAANPLAKQMGVSAEESVSKLRKRLRETGDEAWSAAVGEVGTAYRTVWRILDGGYE